MTDLVLTTYDWVPEPPRGLVRDLRIRWALEEAGLPYRIETTPFREKTPAHFAHQPFGQVPWLVDGDLSIFETGAILLHLGEKSPLLMPADRAGRSATVQWLFAALNSVEVATVAWTLQKFMKDPETEATRRLDGFVALRVSHLEPVLARQPWLVGAFSIADIAMADVLRVVDKFDGLAGHPACRDYVARATGRPAFAKAHADQLAHFAAADPPSGDP